MKQRPIGYQRTWIFFSFLLLTIGADTHALALHGLASGISALVIPRTKIVRIAHQDAVRVTRLILQSALGLGRHAVLWDSTWNGEYDSFRYRYFNPNPCTRYGKQHIPASPWGKA
eukprot:scaffold11998_cov174-Amphora_coffeaeformis.AAC.3